MIQLVGARPQRAIAHHRPGANAFHTLIALVAVVIGWVGIIAVTVIAVIAPLAIAAAFLVPTFMPGH